MAAKWRHNSLDQYMQLSPVNRQQAAVYSYNEPQTTKGSISMSVLSPTRDSQYVAYCLS